MIHIISKFCVIPFYPIGLVITLGLFAFILFILNKKKSGLAALTLTLAILLFFSFPLVAHTMTRSLESRYSPSVIYPQASAIVLLGGSEVPKLPPRIYNETNANGDRIMHAARLFKKGYAPYLITTGGQIEFIKKFSGSEAQISFSLLTDIFGIDSSKILMEPKSKNTRDHPGNIKKILDSLKLKPEIILVTSALHLPRAVAVFKKAGFTVYPAPTDYSADTKFQYHLLNLFPSADAFAQSTRVLHEYYGIISYKILGWI